MEPLLAGRRIQPFLEAAESDNIEALQSLISSGGDFLRAMADEWNGLTLLHVACVAGHLNLVQELLGTMPQFALVKDADGFSPLHIAAARGHVDIARALLGEHPHLWSMKGPDDRIPLHSAIVNGEIDVMRALLSHSPGSVGKTTARKETALHLAVKNNRFEAVCVLVEHLENHYWAPVINQQDNEGNTALHLAVAAKNFQVVDFMLGENALPLVDVNACNKSGRTPLDFLGRGAGDKKIRDIRDILNGAGAIHGRGRDSSLVLEGESKGDIRNALLVVAGLIVNATYQSVLQAPHFKTEVDETHTKGFLAWYVFWMTGCFGRELAYIFFISGNTFGFLVSVQMIICLTKDLPFKLPVLLSMAVMVQTYYGHTYYLPFTSLEKEFGLKNVELFSVLPLTMPILLLLLQRPLALALESYLEELSLFDHLGDMYHI